MKTLCGALVLALSTLASADNSEKTLLLKRTALPIEIDGRIEEAWSAADSAVDFVQHQPYSGRLSSRRTVAKVLATDNALYCMMVCYDDRQNIQRITGKLDDFGGDIVSIMLDTFNDRRTAYKFAVTAAGVRADCRLLDDARDRDYSWDGIWFSAAEVQDWGFVIEMEIPYKSLQYAKETREWGLDFDRWMPTEREDTYWCAYEENEGQRISKFGRLVFEDFYPSVAGLNLEVYPVGIAKAAMIREGAYKVDPDAGVDIFYNPSEALTFQLTGNPDFAQIEADPFAFNISRYETYYSERRPFFTQGNEIFAPSGRQRNSGFYSPLELFYPRRIGRKLPDGSEVPLVVGTKAFGRLGEWEYGGFLALTGEADYDAGGVTATEERAQFGAARVKKQVFGNSSIGTLIVTKHTAGRNSGVVDIDGAFRSSSWQLAYQAARSFANSAGGFAGSAGFMMMGEHWLTFCRGRYIGDEFDVSDVGFVPWRGTGEFILLTGPRWYFGEGTVREMQLYAGPSLNYEKADGYTDLLGFGGVNVQFRSNWGFEVDVSAGSARDQGVDYTSYEVDLSAWFDVSPAWNANAWGGYTKTYNFFRNYPAFYSWFGASAGWHVIDELRIGTSYDMFVEGNPDNHIEDITYNARPYVSVTPVNNLNVRLYVDNLYVRSTDRLERVIGGLLFSYNFLPKSWVYFALNEVRDRREVLDEAGAPLPGRLHTTDRAAVLKVKYLYYF